MALVDKSVTISLKFNGIVVQQATGTLQAPGKPIPIPPPPVIS